MLPTSALIALSVNTITLPFDAFVISTRGLAVMTVIARCGESGERTKEPDNPWRTAFGWPV
jgi:hypothetical protein